MITDARDLDRGLDVECDVAIAGAGAAGITIANYFLGGTQRVCLFESGGLGFEKATQSLYDVEDVGAPNYPTNTYPLQTARSRLFGGTTNFWGGMSRPLQAIDYQKRGWVPHSGWSIEKTALNSYYDQAHRICQLGPFTYRRDVWDSADACRRPLPFSESELTTKIYQYSPPTRFGEAYKEELSRAENVSVFLHANVVNVEINQNASTVQRLHVRCLEGPQFTVRARYFILACGGIENARLLLLSDDVAPAGVGNQHGLVGRYFMDHPTVNTGTLHLSKPRFPLYLYGHSEQKGTVVRGLLHLSVSLQKERQTLNWAASLDPGEKSGYASLISFYRKLVKGRLSEAISNHFPSVMTDFADVVTGLRRRLTGQSHYSPRTRLIYAKVEQAPNPESQVSLSSERDRLGLNKAKLNWRLTAREKRTLRIANHVLDRQARQAGIGHVEPFEWMTSDDAAWPSTLEAYGHHMGTTRMSELPKKGVVDPDCRVHGIDNLFIAGSSVFPTGGCVNPTLTIVALALRLAEHVADLLRK